MGYFANGTEGMVYEERYCNRCKHQPDYDEELGFQPECSIMQAHSIYNYDDCNNVNSILHILIPRDNKGYNKQCTMFMLDAYKEAIGNGQLELLAIEGLE